METLRILSVIVYNARHCTRPGDIPIGGGNRVLVGREGSSEEHPIPPLGVHFRPRLLGEIEKDLLPELRNALARFPAVEQAPWRSAISIEAVIAEQPRRMLKYPGY